jgi:hypothetical protein
MRHIALTGQTSFCPRAFTTSTDLKGDILEMTAQGPMCSWGIFSLPCHVRSYFIRFPH